MRLYAASSNQGKLREFALAAQELGLSQIQLAPLANLKSLAPPEETGHSFEENARLKARFYSNFTDEIVLADDSGLEVDALNGAPGILSARYAGSDANDAANNQLLLDNLKQVENRSARFVCVIALAQRGNVLATFRGEVAGEILNEPCGANGFGYDPLFYYPPLQSSFAALDGPRKFAVSHRGAALRQALTWLSHHPPTRTD